MGVCRNDAPNFFFLNFCTKRPDAAGRFSIFKPPLIEAYLTVLTQVQAHWTHISDHSQIEPQSLLPPSNLIWLVHRIDNYISELHIRVLLVVVHRYLPSLPTFNSFFTFQHWKFNLTTTPLKFLWITTNRYNESQHNVQYWFALLSCQFITLSQPWHWVILYYPLYSNPFPE